MAQAKDNNELEIPENEEKDFTCYGESIGQTLGLGEDEGLESIDELTDKWFKRLNEGDLMINRFQENMDEFYQEIKSLQEKQKKLLEVLAGIKDGEEQNADLVDSIQEVKETIRTGENKSKAVEEKMERF